MLRPRKAPDSLEHRRRQLELQQQILAKKMSHLSNQLSRGAEGLNGDPEKPAEPPVWRLEEDSHLHRRVAEPLPQRNLGRQRQRDMIIFFIMMGALIIVVIMVMALHSHTQMGG